MLLNFCLFQQFSELFVVFRLLIHFVLTDRLNFSFCSSHHNTNKNKQSDTFHASRAIRLGSKFENCALLGIPLLRCSTMNVCQKYRHLLTIISIKHDRFRYFNANRFQLSISYENVRISKNSQFYHLSNEC